MVSRGGDAHRQRVQDGAVLKYGARMERVENWHGLGLAAELERRLRGRELLRIDLAAVVSKHIGETERNLDRIFAAAAKAGALLLLDEADAGCGECRLAGAIRIRRTRCGRAAWRGGLWVGSGRGDAI